MTATSTRPSSTNAEPRPMVEALASLDKALGSLSERAKLREIARQEGAFGIALLLMASTKLLASRKGWPIHRLNAVATAVGVVTFVVKEAQHRKGGS